MNFRFLKEKLGFAKLSPLEESRRIAEKIFPFGKISDSALGDYFMCAPDSIEREQKEKAKERMAFLYTQVISGILNSYCASDTNYRRRYKFVKEMTRYFSWHDVIHAAFQYQESVSQGKTNAIPRFVTAKKAINSEQLIRDEMPPLLFRRGIFAGSFFISIIENEPDLSFEEVVRKFLGAALTAVRNTMLREIMKNNSESENLQIKSISNEFDSITKKIISDPGETFLFSARRIFDAWKKGNHRILFDEFMRMTEPLETEPTLFSKAKISPVYT